MKKHAYLIMAHNEIHMLKKLLAELDDDRNDIYLHIDGKNPYINEDEISSWISCSEIHFVNRVNIYWGTISVVNAEFILLNEAVKKEHSYYHLISGVDFPLKSQDEIHDFFANEDREFISWHTDGFNGDEFKYKIQYFFPLLKFVGKGHFDGTGKKKAFMRMLVRLQWRILECQRKLRIDRTEKYKNMSFYKGDQWFSITHEFAKYILSNKKNILRMYQLTNAPDEIVIQTLALNSVFSGKVNNNSLRQIDWKRGTPYEYVLDDYMELCKSDNFFARKISYNHEPLLVNKLIQHIHGTEVVDEQPLISIIVPCYNVENYLRDCVDSLIAQNYPILEIILVDDGSTDATGIIAKKYAEKYQNIIYVYRENGGLSAARNTGLELAKGGYVAFVDSDDWVDYDYISKLYKAIRQNHSDIAVCGYIEEKNIAKERAFDSNSVISPYSAMKILGDIYLKENVLLVVAWNKLYKRKLFDELSFKEGVIHEDEFMAHRVIGRSDAIAVITDSLYHYRIRENSITGEKKKQDIRHLDILDAFKDRLKYTDGMMYGDLRIFMIYTYFEGIKNLMISFSEDTITDNGLMHNFRLRVLDFYVRYFYTLDSYQKKDYLKFILFPLKYRKKVIDALERR